MPLTPPDPAAALDQLTRGLPALDDARQAIFRDNLALALDGGLAPATLRALHEDGRRFADWCRAQGLAWLPAAPATVAAFLQEMGRSGKADQSAYSPATLDRLAFSIRTWHLLAEVESPTKSTKVKMVRKAQARRVGRQQKQAAALTKDLLDSILVLLADEVAEIETLAQPTPAQRLARLMALRDSALLQTGYCILARGSELLALHWEDIHADGKGDWVAVIRRSKTDQEGLGAEQHLWPRVVTALTVWRQAHDAELALLRQGEGARLAALRNFAERPRERFHPQSRFRPAPTRLLWAETPFVFRGLAATTVALPAGPGQSADQQRYGWSPQLSLRGLNGIIAARAVAARLPEGTYSSHSLRIGAAQDLLAAGKSLPAIMQDGRWKSPQMVLRYVRKLLASRGAMAEWGRQNEHDNPFV